MFDMMGKIREMQTKMKEVQENLAKIETEADAGAGMVKAKVNGKKQLLSLEIEESLFTPGDKDTVQDLVVAAVNKALAAVEEKTKDHMQSATQGMLPNIPGLDLDSFFKK